MIRIFSTRKMELRISFVVFIFIIAGAIAFYTTTHTNNNLQELAKSGEITDGTITDKNYHTVRTHHKYGGNSTSYHYYIDYTFDENNKNINGSMEVSETEYYSVKENDAIQAIYLPNNPYNNYGLIHLKTREELAKDAKSDQTIIDIVALVVIGFVLIVLIIDIIRYQKNKKDKSMEEFNLLFKLIRIERFDDLDSESY